jgi:hypothetical protein
MEVEKWDQTVLSIALHTTGHHLAIITPHPPSQKIKNHKPPWMKLELHPNLVFRFGIGWYFLGIFLTDTRGKLGWYVLVSYIWQEPLFPSLLPPF